MRIEIPYGHTGETLELNQPAAVLESRLGEMKPEGTPEEIVEMAMRQPVGCPGLAELAQGKKKVVLIISDHTRPVPSKVIVPQMLREVRKGNPEAEITLLTATGCHRGTKPEELLEKLGEEIVRREKIVVHDCDDSPCTELGLLPSGAPLVINSLVTEADLVISEGFIEPHFFAGFSGGRKSILPGVCRRTTVLGNHCAEFIRHPKARMGILEGNPINRDMEAAVRMAKLAFIVNVVLDSRKQVVKAFAGDPVEAHHAGCAFLKEYCVVKPPYRGDIVITSNGGEPLDQNVYQAVKGMTTAEAAVSEGGVIILCARCADGIGGDQFYRALSECESASALLREIEAVPMEKTVPDQWQYQILARILEKHHVYFVTGPELAEAIEAMKMEYCPTLEEAYRRARQRMGEEASLLVLPDGISLIPEFEEEA